MPKKREAGEATAMNQDELPGVPRSDQELPASDPISKAARKYKSACEELVDAVERLKQAKGEAKDALVLSMRKADKKSVVVDGARYLLEHIEEEFDIKIKNVKIAG